MSRLRGDSPSVGLRLRAIREIERNGGASGTGPGRGCIGNPLGERLGIAALYGGRGDTDAARAAALLACAGMADTPANRCAVIEAIDRILAGVRRAVEATEEVES